MTETFLDPILHEHVDISQRVCCKESGHIYEFNVMSLYDWILTSKSFNNPITNMSFTKSSATKIMTSLDKHDLIFKLSKTFSTQSISSYFDNMLEYRLYCNFCRYLSSLKLKNMEDIKSLMKNASKHHTSTTKFCKQIMKLNDEYESITKVEKSLNKYKENVDRTEFTHYIESGTTNCYDLYSKFLNSG
jgi:hypothetical protein